MMHSHNIFIAATATVCEPDMSTSEAEKYDKCTVELDEIFVR
jgi:hypothetical protein